jgi:hypothetical protein
MLVPKLNGERFSFSKDQDLTNSSNIRVRPRLLRIQRGTKKEKLHGMHMYAHLRSAKALLPFSALIKVQPMFHIPRIVIIHVSGD